MCDVVLLVATQLPGILVAAAATLVGALPCVVSRRSIVVSVSIPTAVTRLSGLSGSDRLHVAAALSDVAIAETSAAGPVVKRTSSTFTTIPTTTTWAITAEIATITTTEPTIAAITTITTTKPTAGTTRAARAGRTGRTTGGVNRGIEAIGGTAEGTVPERTISTARTAEATATRAAGALEPTVSAETTTTESAAISSSSSEATAEVAGSTEVTTTKPARSHGPGEHDLGISTTSETATKATGFPSLHCSTSLDINLDASILDPNIVTSLKRS